MGATTTHKNIACASAAQEKKKTWEATTFLAFCELLEGRWCSSAFPVLSRTKLDLVTGKKQTAATAGKETGQDEGERSSREGTNLPKGRSLQGKDDFALIVKVKLSETTTTCYIKLMWLFQGFEHASAPQFILHSPGAVIRILCTTLMCEGK